MKIMLKVSPLVLVIILAVSSLIIVESATAQSIPKPSAPEFTVQFVSHPYDVPTTYSTDPYSGETITHQGYHVENRSLEVKIKNQPFTAQLSNGSTVQLYYSVRYKGHFSEGDWSYGFNLENYPTQSTGEYTAVVPYFNSPPRGQMDFQVKALLGYVHLVEARLWGQFNYWEFVGIEGDWSGTQTIDIDAIQATIAPTPQTSQSTPTSTVTTSATQNSTPTTTLQDAQNLFSGFDWEKAAIVGLVVVVAVLAVGMVVMWRKMANIKS